MKRLFLIGLAVAFAVGFVLAQGIVFGRRAFSGWKPGTPPPLTLADAYGLALTRIGAATNHFYCVTASCLEFTNGHLRGWVPALCGWDFSFSDTNGLRASVQVSFDKETYIDDRSGGILASHDVPVLPVYKDCIAMLKAMDGATQTWALEQHKTTADVPTDADLFGPGRYLPQKPRCPQDGHYSMGNVDKLPRCSIPGHTL